MPDPVQDTRTPPDGPVARAVVAALRHQRGDRDELTRRLGRSTAELAPAELLPISTAIGNVARTGSRQQQLRIAAALRKGRANEKVRIKARVPARRLEHGQSQQELGGPAEGSHERAGGAKDSELGAAGGQSAYVSHRQVGQKRQRALPHGSRAAAGIRAKPERKLLCRQTSQAGSTSRPAPGRERDPSRRPSGTESTQSQQRRREMRHVERLGRKLGPATYAGRARSQSRSVPLPGWD